MSESEHEGQSSPFSSIVGAELSSVEFVRDYVQLRFDGPVLTAVTNPEVKIGDTRYEWDSPGYRDKLCERIGKSVTAASVLERRSVLLEFNDGSIISISLEDKDYIGPEAAIFTSAPGDTWIW